MKKIKKFKYLLAPLLGLAVIYGLVSAQEVSFNLQKWTEASRMMWAPFGFFGGFVFAIFWYLNDHWDLK